METFLQQSELKANELQKAQDLQAEALSAQSQAQETIQSHARISQALLTKVSVSAANLQSAIDDATFTFKRGPRFMVGGYTAWSAYAVLLVVIAAKDLRIATALILIVLGGCNFHGLRHLILTFHV